MVHSVASMTGFARLDGAHAGRRWTWELKSVNGRGLEMRFRLPAGFDVLEPDFRAVFAERFKRGSIFANLQLTLADGETRMRLNETALTDAVAAIEKVRSQIDCDAPRAESVLALRGVMEAVEDEPDDAARDALNAALLASFCNAADRLREARNKEGGAIGAVICGHIDEIEALTAKAAAEPGASLAAIRDRVSAQIAEILADGAIPEERLAQEAALIAVKADVREELNRLSVHVGAARALLSRGDAIGRELDFLTQELNRETNTLCSKAQNMDLKRIGLDLKKVIDQLREQVQNIE